MSLLHAGLALADNGAANLDADDTLYLSVVVNRQPGKQLVRALQRDGQLLVSAADLHALGLEWSAGAAADADANGTDPGFVRIDLLPGVSAAYDEGMQRLTLTVPVSMLGHRPQRLLAEHAESSATVDPATQAPGLYVK
jgi:outer membrane usher protein FimD/PapC